MSIKYDLDALLNETEVAEKETPLFEIEYCDPYEYVPYKKVVVDEDGLATEVTPSPVWKDKNGKLHIDYPAFVENFARANNIVCCNGLFYTPDGVVSETRMKSDINYSLIERGWTDRLDVPVNSLFKSLKEMKGVDTLDVDERVIPFANGDLYIDYTGHWVFHYEEKKQTPYRLGVDLVPDDAPMPKFEKWLHDLFEDDDILTIQEMLGYAMLPSTTVQEAFFLVGDASAGKSVLGHILGRIINNGFQAITTADLVTQRFQIASAENKLVLYDDDLGSAALTETGLLKKLITADQPIPAERKYEKGFTFMSYAKVIACANFMLSSLYDDSDGFFRRLHPIHVKPRDPNRTNIPGFGEQIAEEEAEQIARWALRGLKRLIANNWKITWSKRSHDYMAQNKEKAMHYPEFLKETLELSPTDDVSCEELRKLYERWCKANNFQDTKVKRMQNWMSDNAEKEGLTQSRTIVRDGRRVRGYKGVKIRSEWKNVVLFL